MVLLGQVDDETKARALRSVDVYCAPNTGGESFGVIRSEAMAAGATVVASDLNAFHRVLDEGRAGVLVPVHDDVALAEAIGGLLSDVDRRRELAAIARRTVAAFDWSVVAGQVLMVYDTAIAATPGRVHEAGPDISGASGIGEHRA
jgi:phosphatidylinositol alpha-mannosyltransferase